MTLEETLEGVVRRVLREELLAVAAPAAVEPDFVKLSEVARWVQVSRSTLKKWVAAGELASYGKGRLVRVRLAEVRAVLQRRRAGVADPEGPSVARVLSTLRARKAN